MITKSLSGRYKKLRKKKKLLSSTTRTILLLVIPAVSAEPARSNRAMDGRARDQPQSDREINAHAQILYEDALLTIYRFLYHLISSGINQKTAPLITEIQGNELRKLPMPTD